MIIIGKQTRMAQAQGLRSLYRSSDCIQSETGPGVDFWNLRIYLHWHTFSSKVITSPTKLYFPILPPKNPISGSTCSNTWTYGIHSPSHHHSNTSLNNEPMGARLIHITRKMHHLTMLLLFRFSSDSHGSVRDDLSFRGDFFEFIFIENRFSCNIFLWFLFLQLPSLRSSYLLISLLIRRWRDI